MSRPPCWNLLEGEIHCGVCVVGSKGDYVLAWFPQLKGQNKAYHVAYSGPFVVLENYLNNYKHLINII